MKVHLFGASTCCRTHPFSERCGAGLRERSASATSGDRCRRRDRPADSRHWQQRSHRVQRARAAAVARTHRVLLEPETRHGNAGLFGGDPGAVPTEALSMGMATILQARQILLVSRRAAKAANRRAVLRGPVTTRMPGSFLQLHPDVEVVLDGRRLDSGGLEQLAERSPRHLRRSPRAPNRPPSSGGAAPAAA